MVNDEELSNELFDWISQRYYPARAILENAIERGELAKDTNLDIAEMLVVGPLVAIVFYTKTEVNSSSVDSIVKMSLRGLMG